MSFFNKGQLQNLLTIIAEQKNCSYYHVSSKAYELLVSRSVQIKTGKVVLYNGNKILFLGWFKNHLDIIYYHNCFILGYEDCVLVAHDWGGALAWNFATLQPEMVSKVIVMNCPHGAAFQKFVRKSWKQFKMSW